MTEIVQATEAGGEAADIMGDAGQAAPAAPVNERVAMEAAARAARAEDATMRATNRGEATDASKPAPLAATETPAAEGAPAAKPALTKLEELLNGRVEKRRGHEDIERRTREAVAKEYEAKQAEIRKELEAQVRREYAERLRAQPVDAIRDAGLDGSDLVTRLVQQTTPEAKLHNKIVELEMKLAKLTEPIDARTKALEEQHRAWNEQLVEQQRSAGQREFLQIVSAKDEKTGEERFPYTLARFDDPGEMVKHAQAIANRYCEVTGERSCPHADLLEYLEKESRERFEKNASRYSGLLQKRAGAVTVATPSTEPNGRASKPRTLSAQSASERRASPKPRAEWTAQDEEAAMLAAARDAGEATKKKAAAR